MPPPPQTGIANGRAKLTAEQVAEMRRLRKEQGYPLKYFARLYRISISQVSKILLGESWIKKEVTDAEMRALRRKEFLAKFPDAQLFKNWVKEQAQAQGVSEHAIRMQVQRRILQPRIHKLTSHEVYVVP